MQQFTPDLLSVCKSYNIEPQDVILCFALAAGAPPSDAYRIIYKVKPGITTEQCATSCTNLVTQHPGMKILINRIKNKQNPATYSKQEQRELNARSQVKEIEANMTEEERNEYKTRSGIIEKIITQSSLVNGKDAISALQTLAKLQGFDHPDEISEEDKRVYFLPWVSNCRSCELMKEYKKIITEKQPEKG